jgi:hypothetical protein
MSRTLNASAALPASLAAYPELAAVGSSSWSFRLEYRNADDEKTVPATHASA